MIQRFRFGLPLPTDSVVQEIPVSAGPVPFLTAEEDGWAYRMAPDAIVYGLGEMPRGINKRGWHYVTNNTDEARHSEDKLSYYGAHNFLLIDGGAGRECFGVFIDFPGKVRYDIGYTEYDALRFATEEPDHELYIITGDDLNAISRQFRQLIGRSYIPPKWAFGLAQSRFGYKTAEDVREVARQYKENDLPLDMICMDIDYMQDYADFTVNKQRFPDLAALSAELKAQGIRLVPIIDAGVRIDPENPVCAEGLANGSFCTKADGTPFVAAVWPGKAYFADFLRPEVRDWFGHRYKVLTDCGIEGFWNDMNEPVVFPDRTFPMDTRHEYDGMPCSHEKAHNIYGQCMAEASWLGMKRHAPDRRPFLLSRSGFAGLQRFAATWTGDNRSSWEHLKLANFQCQRLAASGISFAGDSWGIPRRNCFAAGCRWPLSTVFSAIIPPGSSEVRSHGFLGRKSPLT